MRWKALYAGIVAGLLALGFLVVRVAVTEVHQGAARLAVERIAALMWKPRFVFDGRTLEARYEVVLKEVCAHGWAGPEESRAHIERFGQRASRPGIPAWLVPLAARRFEAAIAALREKGAQDDWRALTFAGVLEFGRGRGKEAETLLVRAYEMAKQQGELDHPDAASLHMALGTLNFTRGQPAAAEPFLRRAKTILEATPKADERDVLYVLTHLAQTIVAQNFPEEAEPLCAQALTLAETYERESGEAFPQRAVLEENLRKLRSR